MDLACINCSYSCTLAVKFPSMKRIFVIAVLLSAVALMQAQGKFQLGVKTGFNSTSFNTEAGYDFASAKDDFKTGYLVGAWTRIHLLGDLSLQPELYYSKKKSETDFDPDGSESLSYSSWDVPLLVHLDAIDLKLLKIYGVGGPVASFRSKDEVKLAGAAISDYDGDSFKSTNWNFQLGAGVQIARLSLDARYEWGLNDISRSNEMERKTKSLIVSLGFRLF